MEGASDVDGATMEGGGQFAAVMTQSGQIQAGNVADDLELTGNLLSDTRIFLATGRSIFSPFHLIAAWKSGQFFGAKKGSKKPLKTLIGGIYRWFFFASKVAF